MDNDGTIEEEDGARSVPNTGKNNHKGQRREIPEKQFCAFELVSKTLKQQGPMRIKVTIPWNETGRERCQ